MKKPAKKSPNLTFIAEIDKAELVLRMIEGLVNDTRPAGFSAMEVLEMSDPALVKKAQRAAENVVFYVTECINAAQKVN